MSKDSISKTAQVNLQMLARLGVPEAVAFRDALQQLGGAPLLVCHAVIHVDELPVCVSARCMCQRLVVCSDYRDMHLMHGQKG